MSWLFWTLAALFYLFEFFIRVAPSVMIPELMQTFSVDATAIGVLSAFFFYIYAPLQLPVGVLTDRYGARRLLSFAAVIAGIGTLLFAIAHNYWIAALGRFLMGVGSSFGFVGLVYICSHWFPANRRGVMIGLGNTVGMLGAILGQGPLRASINHFGYRSAIFALGIFAFVLAAAIFFFVRGKKEKKKTDSHLLRNLHVVGKNPHSWLNAIMGLFFYVTTPAFAGLWGIPFIHSTYGVSTEFAGFIVSMLFVGWAVGGPVIGIYSDKIRRKKSILILTTLLCATLMSILIYIPQLPIALLFILLFFIGVFSSAELLNFSYSIDINPPFAKATATAFTNFVIILGSVILQPLVGYLLDLNWTGGMENGARTYSPEAFKVAMSCFPIAFFIAFGLGLTMKVHKDARRNP